MYGKGQLTNSLITKARGIVAIYYSIPGNLNETEIGTRVRWLLTKGVFRYGGIDILVFLLLLSIYWLITDLFQAKNLLLSSPLCFTSDDRSYQISMV
jgi:hypothetical protein